ncbi:MAG TPA: HD domain-containing phosphohydrolase, partial [Burkholderiales bacterium]|nr:HD domain-containing phosphohydrolase [Burkholderiales bacterium]
EGNWVGRSASGTPAFRALMAHGGAGAFKAPGLDGVERLFAIARFADTTAGPILLRVGVPVESVVGVIDREMSGALLAVLAVAALTFAATWFWGERLLLRPVSAMSAAAQRLGRGDYVARTGLEYTDDELGELARSFDAMASGLMSKSEILRLNRALRTLSRCNGNLIRAESETGLLNEICRTIVETGEYRMAWVGYAEIDESKTVRAVAQHGYEAGYLEKAHITWADVERGRGPTGVAIRTGMPQFNQDFLTNPLLAPWRDEALKRGFQSSAALPLKDGPAVFGALTIYAEQPDTFTAEEQTLLIELANDLAFGIVTLRAGAMHRQAQERLQRSMVATIHAMAATLETRDPYTAGHQRRVAELAVAIARELGLPEDEIQGIHLAGIVHDLGKISVPAEILSKPGRLTDLEYQIVKTHVQAGYDILKGIDFPWPIAQLVLQHHERLDGSGYPHGLKDKEILLGARILGVADTVEPMASHRPYRPGLGIAAALKEIAKNRGTLYDSAVADACEKLFNEKGFKFSKQGGALNPLNAIVDVANL